MLLFTIIPLAINGGADADKGGALADGVLVVAAHAHGEGIHLHVGVAALSGLHEQLVHRR